MLLSRCSSCFAWTPHFLGFGCPAACCLSSSTSLSGSNLNTHTNEHQGIHGSQPWGGGSLLLAWYNSNGDHNTPNHVHTNILQKKKTMWFFMGLLACFLSGDHGRVGLWNAADSKSFKWTFAKLTHTVIAESIVYRIWTLRFSQLEESIQGHICNVHGYLYALLSCDIVSILTDDVMLGLR